MVRRLGIPTYQHGLDRRARALYPEHRDFRESCNLHDGGDGISKLSFLKVECVSIFRCFIEDNSVFVEDDLRFFVVGVSMDGRRWQGVLNNG